MAGVLDEKKENLRRICPAGVTIFTIRMSPKSFKYKLLVVQDGRIVDITARAKEVCGLTRSEDWIVKGYNFNHPRSCVELLAQTLYGDMFALWWQFI